VRRRAAFFQAGVVLWLAVAAAQPGARREGPARQLLLADALITVAGVNECSGLAASVRHEGVLWAHNDSGGEARVFPLGLDGGRPAARAAELPPGIEVTGARNRDWEDIAHDGAGRLVLGDFGNNANSRRDLCLYVVDEPDPAHAVRTTPARQVRFYYPEQRDFPPETRAQRRWDCEALIARGDAAWVLTKEAEGGWTGLYRIDTGEERDEPQAAELVARLEVGGQVTAADLTPAGDELVVLTYGRVWRFPWDGAGVSGPGRYLPIFALQCEALAALPDGRLLIGNEQNGLSFVERTALKYAARGRGQPERGPGRER